MTNEDRISEADEMFEALGYKQKDVLNVRKEKVGISFGNVRTWEIIDFDDKNKTFTKPFTGITMEELKAINKKCEELGWLEWQMEIE